ncbi:YHS domain-containing (seleno)protein [Rhizobium sp. NPDC090279]|uniref:YHS domain-containing (seleno)protein n=1 Tax=Rhizobium sp. NPDC090279 TaxID=3364499 RepID=UPI00383B66D3
MVSFQRAAALAIALTAAGISTAGADEIFSKNGIAINGYDPVAYFTDHKPVKGSQKYTAKYEGATFYFASADHRDMFASDPTLYAPQFGGYCAYGAAEGHKAPTEPQAYTVVDGKLYLNYNDDVLKTWRQDVPGYIAKANANWGTVKTQPAP